jgi:hypothetical protein
MPSAMIFAHRHRAAAAVAAALSWSCVTPPRPTPEAVARAANPHAIVEGRVLDREGRAVAGILVRALPRGKDIEWSPPAVTDSEGRFRLSLVAPAEYGFLLLWKGRTVVTRDERDPARLRLAVEPAERREGIELLFLRDEWNAVP